MSSLPRFQPRHRDAAKPIDDFEWPPTADDLSVYEVGPDAWQTRQPDVPRRVPAVRQHERSQPHREPAPERATDAKKLAGIVAASAIAAAAAGCVLYGSMSRPVPVRAVHHPAPPVVATPPPPRITIVATYPVQPAPSNEAPASLEPALGDAAAAPRPVGGIDTPRVATHAAPIEAPVEATVEGGAAPAPSETAAPSGEPAAVDPGPVTPDPGVRSGH